MYAEITIIATYDRKKLSKGLLEQIGPNRVQPEVGVKGTIFEQDQASVKDRIIATEVIGNSASVIYFFEGTDTVTVHVTAATVMQLKTQAERITRQMRPMFDKKRKRAAKVAIFVQEAERSDELIIAGEYVSRISLFKSALLEKWLSKLLTPALVFFLATKALSGTTAATSAFIALAAAGINFVVEAAGFAYTANEWKWRDAK